MQVIRPGSLELENHRTPSDTQEIPRFWETLQIYYRVHKSVPLDPILSLLNRVNFFHTLLLADQF
jgi:hypothetical protein